MIPQANETGTEKAMTDRIRSMLRHDLFAPMTSLQGFVEIMLTRRVTDLERRRYLLIIHSETKRLIAMVDELLAEKPESPLDPKPHPTD